MRPSKFIDKPVDPKDVRTAIEIATLAPSAHNSQPWKFVVVREKNAELAKLAYGSNFEQVSSAPVTIALLPTQIWLNVLVRLPELAALITFLKSNYNTS